MLNELPANGSTVLGEQGGILRVRGQPAPEEDLSVVAPEHLLVRRQHDDLTGRLEFELHARAGETHPRDQLLDDAAEAQVVDVPLRQVRKHCRDVCPVIEPHHDVAVARHAVVELDHNTGGVGPRPTDRLDRRPDLVEVRTSSIPYGAGTPAALNSRRPALLKPSGRRSGDVPTTGAFSARATATSSTPTFHGSIRAGRSAMCVRRPSMRSGRASNFAATGPLVLSGTSRMVNRRGAPNRTSSGMRLR